MQFDRKLLHIERMDLRWGDMDALGHTNNTVYFRLLEQARIAWFESLGLNYLQDGEGAILGSVSCRFIIPIVYPAQVEVSVLGSTARTSSFGLASEIRDAAQPDRLYATGEAVMVWIDIRQGKSKPVPDWLRARLQP